MRKFAAIIAILGVALSGCGTLSQSGIALGHGERSVAGTYLAGNFAASQGDTAAAAGFFEQSLKDDPTNKDLLTRTFLYTATSGDMDHAVALADRIVAAEPDNRAARLILAVAAMERRDYAAAREQTTKSAAGPFTSLTNAMIQAWSFEGQGDTDAALKALEYLSAQQGLQGMYIFEKALILDHAGRTADADNAYRQSLGINPGPRSAEAYGRFLERQGRTEEAIALYSALNKDNPGNPIGAFSLARVRAKRTAEPLVRTPADGTAEALFGIAASLNDERSADVAMLYLNLALYLRPDFDVARVLIADRYESQEQFAKANAIYAKISSSSPYYGMVQVQSAINEARMGHDDQAIAQVRALAEALTNDVDAWSALGDLYRGKERYQDAAAAYDKAIAAAGAPEASRWGLFYARGVSLERAGRWNDAERDFREALVLSPDQPQVLNYLGYSWVDQGKHLDEAVLMLEKAHALKPQDGYIADSVGWAYYRLGRYQEAAAALEQAVLLAPGDPTINDHLGDAYWRIGRRDDAQFQWNHALSLGPDDKDKPAIQRKIEHGLDSTTASGS